MALALAILFGARQEVFAATRTIVLNTGYDQWLATPAPIPVGGLDNEWRVIVDPTNPPPGNPVSTGRRANVVIDTTWRTFPPLGPSNSSGGANYPDSVWISINPSRNPGNQSPPTDFEYAYYFTLPPGFSSPQLTMHLSADDHVTKVTLNSCTLFKDSGGIFNAAPLMLPDATNPLFPSNPLALSCLNSGPIVNVLTVTVQDTAGGLTGLIVDGAVTYEDCDRLPLQDIPGLTSITFWERTSATPVPTTIVKASPALTGRLTTLGPGSNDFVGVPSGEFYDVFYSTWNGTPKPDGEFVTIEAVWNRSAPIGGGLNIARVDFIGTGLFADSVASFVALGDNALPNLVGNVVDTDTLTQTTMGNTIGTPQRLRLTVGFPCACTQAKICVFKFNDLDNDGFRAANEPLLPNWTFNVNPGPPNQVTTGPQGSICFDVTAPGAVAITEEVRDGWVPTTPTSQSVPVQPEQVANVFFGNRYIYATRLSRELWNLQGNAEGGTFTAVISGCSVSFNTRPGQSAEEIAQVFAAAINEDACLQAQDVHAQAVGTTVSVIGPAVEVSGTSITDPGIQHEAIPTLPVQDFATAVRGSGSITEVVFVQGEGTLPQTAASAVFLSESGEALDMQSILLTPNSTASAFFEGDAQLDVGHLQTLLSPGVVASQVIRLSVPGVGDLPPIGVPSSPACQRPVVALKRNLEFDTGVALSNTSGETVSCDWSIYSGSEATLVGTGTTLLLPLGQSQYFPLNDPSLAPLELLFEGNLQLLCNGPVHAFSLFQRAGDGALFSNAAGCLDQGGAN